MNGTNGGQGKAKKTGTLKIIFIPAAIIMILSGVMITADYLGQERASRPSMGQPGFSVLKGLAPEMTGDSGNAETSGTPESPSWKWTKKESPQKDPGVAEASPATPQNPDSPENLGGPGTWRPLQEALTGAMEEGNCGDGNRKRALNDLHGIISRKEPGMCAGAMPEVRSMRHNIEPAMNIPGTMQCEEKTRELVRMYERICWARQPLFEGVQTPATPLKERRTPPRGTKDGAGKERK